MGLFRIGQLVRVKEDFDELAKGGKVYPGINPNMLDKKGKLFFIQVNDLTFGGREEILYHLLPLEGSSRVNQYAWKGEWLESVDSIDDVTMNGTSFFLRDLMDWVEEEYPYLTKEMYDYAKANIREKKVEVEEVYSKEVEGHVYFSYKLKGHPFLWHPALFKRAPESDSETTFLPF